MITYQSGDNPALSFKIRVKGMTIFVKSVSFDFS